VLYAPTDIEGHLGLDNRFYVLGERGSPPLLLLPPPLHVCNAADVSSLVCCSDFARTLPPARINRQLHPNGYLYQLLRPEFVKTYSKPLSR
jgi:hypothetical protein